LVGYKRLLLGVSSLRKIAKELEDLNAKVEKLQKWLMGEEDCKEDESEVFFADEEEFALSELRERLKLRGYK